MLCSYKQLQTVIAYTEHSRLKKDLQFKLLHYKERAFTYMNRKKLFQFISFIDPTISSIHRSINLRDYHGIQQYVNIFAG